MSAPQRVRSGTAPPLTGGFTLRPESIGGVENALVAGATLVLAPAEDAPDRSEAYGKTQLAVSLAESLWRSAAVDLLIWITATSRASVLSGYARAAADATGIVPVGDAESVAARFLGWLGTTGRPWLVVLDDLVEPTDLHGLRPSGPAGRVLITTSASPPLPDDPPHVTVPVRPFSPREAMNYMVGRLPHGPHQRTGAMGLIEDLRYEPLALAQAVAVIRSTSMSCREYADSLERKRPDAGDGASPTAIASALSFEHAQQLSPGSLYLLVLGALLDGHQIPAAVFTTSAAFDFLAGVGVPGLAGPEPARGALQALRRAGLLTIDPAESGPAVRISPVVQAAVRAATPGSILNRAAKAAAESLLQAWPGQEPQVWTADALRSCAAALQRLAGDLLWQRRCHPLLFIAGNSLDTARLTGPAIAYWNELAATSERVLGPGHPDSLSISDHLAGAYLAAGQATQAVTRFRRCLTAWQTAAGADHPGALSVRTDLGRALVAAGRPVEAATALTQAIAESERVRGPAHPDTLDARDALADAHRAAGQLDNATEQYRRCLADRDRHQGQRHPATMTTRHKLAETCLAGGQGKDAISHFKRALADRERALGPDHPDTIASRSGLGSAYQSAGRMASAVRLYEQASGESDRILGVEHPDALRRSASLAHAYYAVGRLTDAITLLRATAERCDRTLPPTDPFTATLRASLTNIAGD